MISLDVMLDPSWVILFPIFGLVVTRGLQEIAKLQGHGLGGTDFDYIALGTGSTAAAAGDVALVTEITTGGGARRGAADVTATLVTTTFTDDTIRFDTTWTFSAAFGVFEFGIFNGSTPGDGDPAGGSRMLLRQVFAAVFNVAISDIFNLKVDVIGSDDAAGSDSRLTRTGIVEGNKRIATDLTPADGSAMRYIAAGSGTTAVSDTLTALTTEISGNGLARAEATVSLVTTNVTNDTVQLTKTFSVTGTQAVNEMGVFSASSGGVMWLRQLFGAVLNLINSDSFTWTAKIPQVTA